MCGCNEIPCTNCGGPSPAAFNSLTCEVVAVKDKITVIEHEIDILQEDNNDELLDLIDTKVDKITGKQLSENDFTDAYKEILDNIDDISGVATSSTVADLRADDSITPVDYVIISDKGKEGLFMYDPLDTTSIDNTGTILVTATAKRYKRVFTSGLNVNWFGAVEDGTTNSTSAVQAAIVVALAGNNKRIEFGAGPYLLGPTFTAGNGVSIIGSENLTKIVKTSTRGHIFDIKGDDNTIKNFDMNCNASTLDGAVWISGNRNFADRLIARNTDAYSICVEGNWSDGTQFIPIVTEDNIVSNCRAIGQKRYHEVGGKSAFIAGGKAKRTRFINCSTENCVGDNFDSDDAPDTQFINCKARQTGVQSTYAALWVEGEQTDNVHAVTVVNFEAENFSIGIGVSERVELNVKGATIRTCKNAVRGINNLFVPTIADVKAYNCGNGFASSDIDGVFAFSDGVNLINCQTYNSQALQSFANYNPGGAKLGTTMVDGCDFDKRFRVSYDGGGSQDITLSNSVIRGDMIWYNASNVTFRAINVDVVGAGIVGARIKSAMIQNSRFKASSNSQIAITMQLDTFNTSVDNCLFDGYASIGDNVTIGLGNKYKGVTTIPIFSEESFVRGNANTRTSFVGTANGEFKTGALVTSGAIQNTGMPDDPNGDNVWYIYNMHEENGSSSFGGAQYWSVQWATPLKGSSIYTRIHNASTNAWTSWNRLHDNTWFPVLLTSVVAGQYLRFNGTNFVNATPTIFDLSTTKTGTNTPDVGAITGNGVGIFTIPVTGAALNGVVSLGPPSTIEAGLTWSGYVSVAGTVTVRLYNTTASTIDPSPAEWRVIVQNI